MRFLLILEELGSMRCAGHDPGRGGHERVHAAAARRVASLRESSGDRIRRAHCGYLSVQGHEPAAGGEAMNDQQTTVRVWDFLTRASHEVLAACVPALSAADCTGGNAMVSHLRLGHAVCVLHVLRLVWGSVSGRWSRLASFVGLRTLMAALPVFSAGLVGCVVALGN